MFVLDCNQTQGLPPDLNVEAPRKKASLEDHCTAQLDPRKKIYLYQKRKSKNQKSVPKYE